MQKYFLVFLSIVLLANGKLYADDRELKVCATIRPLYSLVYSVTEGAAATELLFSNAGVSPHDYVFTPSNIKQLAACDVIFLISQDLESFMTKAVKSTAKKTVTVVEFAKEPQIKLLPVKESNVDADKEHIHDDSDEEEHHNHHHHHHDSNYDVHFWLDTENAGIMAQIIAQVLSKQDPKNASIYVKNAHNLKQKLQSLDKELFAQLKPYAQVPYIVFHDAYQYFEKRYNLHSAGAVTVNPERMIGAKKISSLQELITSRNIKCMFAEPQFPTRILDTIAKTYHVSVDMLDAEWGPNEVPPQEIYFKLMNNLADNLSNCLKRTLP